MRSILLAGLFAGSALIGAGPASAASVGLSPTRLFLGASAPVQTLTVYNGDAKPKIVQLRLFAWSQDDGEDRLTPTTELIANPLIVKIPGRSKQVVRVGFRNPPGAAERTYRIFVEEVPVPGEAKTSQIRTRVRFSLPVFIATATPRTEVKWRLVAGRDGKLALEAENSGSVHAEIEELTLRAADGAEKAHLVTGRYLLTGNRRRFALPLTRGDISGPVTLSVKGNPEGKDISLSVEDDGGPLP